MIAENERVIALVPLNWEHTGHALVIPRRAVRSLNDMTDEDVVAVIHMVKRIAVAQERAFGASGFTVEQNNGRNQDVCHAHFHVIPNSAPKMGARPSRAEMDEVAAKLKSALPVE